MSNMNTDNMSLLMTRREYVQVKLTRQEMQELTRKANSIGVSRSAWIRMKIHEGDKK